MVRIAAIVMALLFAAAAAAAAAGIEMVRPSAVDPAVRRFDDASVVIAGDRAAPLAIFLTGTGGRPENVVPLLKVIAGQGYRVIGLAYDDEPAVQQVCPHTNDPECAAAFRAMRIYGDGGGGGHAMVANSVAESIQGRLVALLRYLAQHHPGGEWEADLDASGLPAWDRIVVSGLPQGAGMAAFIAKQHAVRRVVLFSSPWDTAGPQRLGRLAPWLGRPSATPPDRWWAERHARELTTDLLARAYADLAIPPDHLLVFDKGLPPDMRGNASNPYHGSTVRLADYAPQWRILYGAPG